MRFVLYARKSSENEERQVQSIDDQVRILQQVAQERGWQIAVEITESKSAKDPGVRPGFDRMIALLEKGQAEGILCWSVNRLSRNPIDSGRLSWMLQTGKLQVIQTPEKPYLPTDNVLIFSVETGVANQYILDLKKAVRRGLDSKIAKGWYPHRAPEGYRNNLQTHTIEADPERFALIERAWRLLLTGSYTIPQVTHLMNAEWGYRTRKTLKGRGGDQPLSRSASYRLFGSVFYAGYFEHAGVTHKGSHPAMISLSEFNQVQRLLAEQSGRTHFQRHAFAYSGMIRCGQCGRTLTPEVQTGRHGRGSWVYYRCVWGNGKCSASKRSIREDVLEKRLDDCLAGITISEEFQQIVKDLLEKWIRDELYAQESVYRSQMTALADGEKMLNELLEMRLKSLIDDATYRSKQQELQESVSRLRLSVGTLQERIDHTRRVIEQAMDFRRTAHAQFSTGDGEKRRQIARALATRFVVQEGEAFIEINPLLRFMLPGKTSTNGAASRPEFEPLEQDSQSAKKTVARETVLPGWADGTLFEPLTELFRSVWEGQCTLSKATLL